MLSRSSLLFSRLPNLVASQCGYATKQSYQLPDLKYDYGALEPHISAEIMEIHHKKHHQAYITNLMVTLEQIEAAQAKGDLSKQIAVEGAFRFNAGGHINHTLFWENLAPANQSKVPEGGPLHSLITQSYGDLNSFITTFNTKTAAVRGSGWGWLGFNKETKRVEIATTPNQDPLEATTGLVPLIGIDVWEHAYYLQYKNVRPDYLKAIWKVINWEEAEKRLAAAQK